jgi:hypothetical protein
MAISLLTEIEARLVRRYEQELGIVMQCVRVRDGHVSTASLPQNLRDRVHFR